MLNHFSFSDNEPNISFSIVHIVDYIIDVYRTKYFSSIVTQDQTRHWASQLGPK